MPATTSVSSPPTSDMMMMSCSVSIDPTVGMHGCVLETELGRVDESVEARLDVLLASLDTVP